MVGQWSNSFCHPSAAGVVQTTGTIENNKRNRRCGPKPRARQRPFITCAPGPKTTLLSTLHPSQNTLHYKMLTMSPLEQASQIRTGRREPGTFSPKQGSLDFTPLTQKLTVSSGQRPFLSIFQGPLWPQEEKDPQIHDAATLPTTPQTPNPFSLVLHISRQGRSVKICKAP